MYSAVTIASNIFEVHVWICYGSGFLADVVEANSHVKENRLSVLNFLLRKRLQLTLKCLQVFLDVQGLGYTLLPSWEDKKHWATFFPFRKKLADDFA